MRAVFGGLVVAVVILGTLAAVFGYAAREQFEAATFYAVILLIIVSLAPPEGTCRTVTASVKDMKPEVVQQWVADLRSGEFTKATGMLVDTDQGEKCRCALGVLLYRAEEQGVVVRNGPDFFSPGEFYPTNILLPTSAQVWAGIEGTSNPIVTEGDDTLFGSAYHYKNTVVDLNDDYGKSFEELADIIEAELASS